jgi:hypothetical protein
VERDWFAADGRQAVEAWIERCQALLDDFEQEVYRRQGDDVGGADGTTLAAPPGRPLRSVAPVPPPPDTEEVG